ncbi:MAG TPA: PspC domain-containing protein [Gaiellaceae bacterium]|nr:PspC domain-containing protein [Gaiellaceae bacterium]
MTETTERIPRGGAEPRRLTRSHDARWLGGVCVGLGGYFDLNPIVYRIAFAALALAGGTGILLYVAAWLVIPDEGAEDSIAAAAIKRHRERPWLLVGVGLLAFGSILALSQARFWPSPGNLWLAVALGGAAIVWWQVSTHVARAPAATAAGEPAAPAPRRRSLLPAATGLLIVGLGVIGLLDATDAVHVDWRIALAAAAVALGGVVALGAVTGQPVGGVVVLGLAVLAALALAFAVRVPLFSGIGDQVDRPATFAGLHSRYEHGIGDYRLDLRSVSFPVGLTGVKVTLGIGNLIVRVPRDVTVEADGRASGGDVRLLGHEESGTGVHDRVVDTGTLPGHVLVLDARVGFGKLTVERG